MRRADKLGMLLKNVADSVGEPPLTPPEIAGQQVAAAQIVEQLPLRRTRTRRRVALAAMLLAGLAAILYRIVAPHPMGLPFRIDRSESMVATQEWIRAPHVRTVVFEQGSRFTLAPESISKVTSAESDSVRVYLKTGRISADVTGNGHTRWMVEAGPYLVTVLGTLFTVDFDDERQNIDVAVTRGKVLVQTRGGPDHGVVVPGGKRLHATLTERTVSPLEQSVPVTHRQPGVEAETAESDAPPFTMSKETSSLPKASIDNEVPLPPLKERTGTRMKPHTSDERTVIDDETGTPLQSDKSGKIKGSGTNKPHHPQDWISLYDDGAYEDALLAAQTLGIEPLSEHLNAPDLWKLQDGARVTGRHALTQTLLMTFKRRFPHHPNTATAGFLLGRMACDRENDYSKAAQYFEHYLKEAPNGPLVEETLGRLVTVYSKSGQKTLAKQRATRYLSDYPNGAFVPIARAASDDD